MDFSKPTFVEIGQTANRAVIMGEDYVKFSDMMKVLELSDGNHVMQTSTINLLNHQLQRLRNPVLTAADCERDPAAIVADLLQPDAANRQAVLTLVEKLYAVLTDVTTRHEQLRNTVTAMTPHLVKIHEQTLQLSDKINLVLPDPNQATLQF